jgi:phosphomannomutase
MLALIEARDEAGLSDRCSTRLGFGTAGLRGELGAGPNRMNRVLVAQAAAGLAEYLKKNFEKPSAVIGYDGRINSDVFARDSAEIMAAAGIETFLFDQMVPTPVVAFAVKQRDFSAGVMVTASHNPPRDNGYKVYLGGENGGGQIVSPADAEISVEIKRVAATQTFDEIEKSDSFEFLGESSINDYVRVTKSVVGSPSEKQIKVVYTAMHGVGWATLEKLFDAANIAKPIVVNSQIVPDGNFPTVAFPNPEEPGAMDLSIKMAQKTDADLVIATDPDADRCAVAVMDPKIGWRILHGDELGAVFAYVISQRNTSGVFANSIVSSTVVKKIAEKHSIKFQEVLTGFKWISKVNNLSFGYEEALGYCVDPLTVNDKDGISAAIFIAQIASDLARNGKTILDLLDEIWNTHGYHATEQISIRLKDLSQVKELLNSLRKNPPQNIAGRQVTLLEDLSKPKDGLPPTDGLRMWLEGSIRIIIRPSGTEPKLKCYIEVIEINKEKAVEILNQLRPPLKELLS